ncbi:MAG: DUF3810 domain-containing protein [Roseburia sp.]|nr:DUF3810 domain-containing protein [Roseburia sp.]
MRRIKTKEGQREKDRRGKSKRGRGWLILAIAGLILALNIAAWSSTAFCDWYIAHIFPIWVNTYGRITGLFPFSVGEWLIAAGVLLLGAAAVIAVLCGVCGIVKLAGRGKRIKDTVSEGECVCGSSGKAVEASMRADAAASAQVREKPLRAEKAFLRFAGKFYRFFGWTLLAVCLIMTLNCLILYHASTFSEHYFGEDNGEYSAAELVALYNMVAEECNRLAGEIKRNEAGEAVYESPQGTEISVRDAEGWKKGLGEMADEAGGLMRQLGERYPQLRGWYPRPKALVFSDFMCQQYMQGYYFPFSMEANYNDVMHILNIPSTMCHELAHLRGYIYEDEANFIGYLACVQSENPFFQYAGYLSVLNYLYNDVYKLRTTAPGTYEAALAVITPVTVSEQVWKDNIFVADEEWDRINGKALLDTEFVDAAADVFIDTNLKVNGVADGKFSYNRVVRLLMQYYRQELGVVWD